MLRLPLELRRLCISLLDDVTDNLDETVDTLKQLRFVNKDIGTLATEFLFGTAVLRSTNDSAEAFHKLVQSKYSRLVRRAVIYTDTYEEDEQDESELLDSFAEAVGKLSSFQSLQELQLKFAVECASEPDTLIRGYFKDVCETPEYRTAVLKVVLQATEGVSSLRTLSIRNLQDRMDRQIFESDSFRSIRSRLTSLHLQIATEEREQGELYFAAIHRGFTVDLPELWLKPMASHLTHLTLYCYTAMWGLFPFVDFRQIGTLPSLESLSLGNWTIAHDWQIEWILSHGPTLKQLLLDDCPIVVALRMAGDDNMVRLNFPDLRPLQGDDWAPFFTLVSLRWHTVFDRFRTSLYHLEHFATYGSVSNWTEDAFEYRYNLENSLRANRYYTFNCGSVPPWADWEDPVRPYNRDHIFFHCRTDRPDPNYRRVQHPACLDEDLEALGQLMEEVKMRGSNVM
ncbi:hypothetical protein E8E12_004031 [Didymella heteroderae]|uniref:Uncharacterized protein n=1 Tax=Didymella heteroderae TaxID=1769908 RepID=A0A9P4WNN4_9PLEO|nr:hypothetical protein E8E12_004031 [Didymella heteroderae]